MSRFARLLAVTALLVLALAACGADEDPEGAAGTDAPADGADEPDAAPDEDGEDAQAQADDGVDGATTGEGLTIVAPVYPLAWVAQQIAPGATVELLTDAGADPHDIELTPRGRQLLETADAVLYLGDIGYQPQVETALGDSRGTVVSFADAVGEQALRDWDHDHSHDDHSHDDHDHDDHDHGAHDPHAWFDAALMAEFAEAVGEALAAVDSGAADDYRANAAALADRFRDAEGRIAELLGGTCTHDRVIVSHEAYAYLLAPFGLSQEGVSGVGGHGPASPQRIAQLVQLVQAEGIEYVLAEPLEGRDDAFAVADEAGIEVLDIYSLEVAEDEGLFEERGFLTLLVDQAETVGRALGCE